jgi:O-antigen ligase
MKAQMVWPSLLTAVAVCFQLPDARFSVWLVGGYLVFAAATIGILPILTLVLLFGVGFLALIAQTTHWSVTIMALAISVVCIGDVIISPHSRTKAALVRLRAPLIWLTLLAVLATVSYCVSERTDYGEHKLLYFLAWGYIYFLCAVLVLIQDVVMRTYWLCVALVLLSAHYAVLNGTPITVGRTYIAIAGGLRNLDGFDAIGEARLFGCVLVVAVCWLMLDRLNLSRALLVIGAAGVAAPIVAASQTRQVLLALGFVLVVWLPIVAVRQSRRAQRMRGTREGKTSKWIVLACVLFASGLPIAAGRQMWNDGSLKLRLEGEHNVGADLDSLGGDRLEMWAFAVQELEAHPMTGWGWGDYRFLAPDDWPHNLMLEAWGEMGLLGLGLCLYGVYKMLLGICKTVSYQGMMWSAGAIVMLFVVQVSGDFAGNSLLVFYIVLYWAGSGVIPRPHSTAVSGRYPRLLKQPLRDDRPGECDDAKAL